MYEVRNESVCVRVFEDTSGGLLHEIWRLDSGVSRKLRFVGA